jgi:hypothetical protein
MNVCIGSQHFFWDKYIPYFLWNFMTTHHNNYTTMTHSLFPSLTHRLLYGRI